jgi:hypothetical protein
MSLLCEAASLSKFLNSGHFEFGTSYQMRKVDFIKECNEENNGFNATEFKPVLQDMNCECIGNMIHGLKVTCLPLKRGVTKKDQSHKAEVVPTEKPFMHNVIRRIQKRNAMFALCEAPRYLRAYRAKKTVAKRSLF